MKAPSASSMRLPPGSAPFLRDAKRVRFDYCRDCDTNRRQADHAVHECNQLGHFGHLDALGHHCANAATHHEATEHVAEPERRFTGQLKNQRSGCHHRNGHTHHAKTVARDRRRQVRQPLECLNENTEATR